MNDPMAKMYSELTPAELGVLAVKYGIAGNDLELARIRKACPRKTYIMNEVSYGETITRFVRMANLWGLLHWQYQYDRMRAALHMAIALNRKSDKPEEDEIHQVLFSAMEGRLVAIDAALNEACTALGFDAADARTLIGTDVFVPLKSSSAVANPKVLEEVKMMLLGILAETS